MPHNRGAQKYACNGPCDPATSMRCFCSTAINTAENAPCLTEPFPPASPAPRANQDYAPPCRWWRFDREARCGGLSHVRCVSSTTISAKSTHRFLDILAGPLRLVVGGGGGKKVCDR